jgi:hypothetical protein
MLDIKKVYIYIQDSKPLIQRAIRIFRGATSIVERAR